MYPKVFMDDTGMVWHRCDHLTQLERQNSYFRARGPIMYARPRKSYRVYVGQRQTGILERLFGKLREILSLG